MGTVVRPRRSIQRFYSYQWGDCFTAALAFDDIPRRLFLRKVYGDQKHKTLNIKAVLSKKEFQEWNMDYP
jgi:hypothetical protein